MLVLVSGAARVLGSKFVDDLPLKADLGASRSHLDTLFLWIQCCVMVPVSMDLSLMNQCFMFVMANLITYVCLHECLDLAINESVCMLDLHNDVILDFSMKLQPKGLLFF